MENVIACIDGSSAAISVSRYAAWAAQRMGAALTLLHVLDENRYPAKSELSGNIGLGSQEALLDELAELDEKRAKLALQQGHLMLDKAHNSVAEEIPQIAINSRQRHGQLVDTLLDIEPETRLTVLGLHGEEHEQGDHIGSQLETILRRVHRPVLLVPDNFNAPSSVLLAFDNSETTRKGVQMVAASPLLKGLPVHVVMVGAASDDHHSALQWAVETLQQQGHDAKAELLAGDVEASIHQYQQQHQLDLLVMGAYGHSRIRQLLVGSTTTKMLETSASPLLVLR
ncbi:universal stress protein UspA [Idiomarina tyrosinivorans]|uniref:Universal stress protein UspA n=1 Tax=Idiomarina tyrosinivorans TaxID=1445662 RepID=A0A432ZTQ0_9GAMM|nr:universal stress protein [Idiomarina tyrosinivorans]RUO81314.1 universal stress protein UspA [Idiomarina tyrosinivorans]